MRRDYGSEILVAIGAASVLVFALAFAVILIVAQSASSTAGVSPSPTLAVSVMALATGTTAGTEVAGSSLETATDVPAQTAVPEDTLVPTETLPPETPSPAVRSTASPNPTTSPFPVMSSATPLPASSTPAPATATVAPTRTHTMIPPSSTSSPTPTLTNTVAPPTATSEPTATPTSTATLTSSPTTTRTPTVTPTSSSTPTPTQVPPTATIATAANGCPIPQGWAAYTVQLGDTLFSLARRSGSTVSEIRAGNCLTDDTIFALQTLYLPAAQTLSMETVVVGCNAPGVLIDPSLVGRVLSGVFEVRGTAIIENFAYYRLEIRALDATSYQEIRRGRQAVVDGVLARISAERFSPGEYRLRLVVVDARGAFLQPCEIPLIIQ